MQVESKQKSGQEDRLSAIGCEGSASWVLIGYGNEPLDRVRRSETRRGKRLSFGEPFVTGRIPFAALGKTPPR